MMLTFEEVRTLLSKVVHNREKITPTDKNFRRDYMDGIYDLESDLAEALNKLEIEHEARPKVTNITSYRDGTEEIFYSDGTKEVLFAEELQEAQDSSLIDTIRRMQREGIL